MEEKNVIRLTIKKCNDGTMYAAMCGFSYQGFKSTLMAIPANTLGAVNNVHCVNVRHCKLLIKICENVSAILLFIYVSLNFYLSTYSIIFPFGPFGVSLETFYIYQVDCH